MKSINCLFTLFFCSTSIAGTAQGVIQMIESGPLYGSKVFIMVDGSVTDQPACRLTSNFHFAFDTAEPGGKELFSLVLSAKAAKQQLRISGYGTCSKYSGVEDLRWLRIE